MMHGEKIIIRHASLRLVFDQDMYQEIEDREKRKEIESNGIDCCWYRGSALGGKGIHQAYSWSILSC